MANNHTIYTSTEWLYNLGGNPWQTITQYTSVPSDCGQWAPMRDEDGTGSSGPVSLCIGNLLLRNVKCNIQQPGSGCGLQVIRLWHRVLTQTSWLNETCLVQRWFLETPICTQDNVGSAHWSPISLVPHLIGPLLIGPPTHWSPNTLLELIGPPSHWSPISLVPHLIGPPFHSSPHHRPIPMVPHLIGPPSHWFPISLVPQLISLPSHWSPNWHPCITHSIGPPSHWSPRLIGPPFYWSANSLVPFSLVPQFISPQLHIGPPFHSSTQFRPIPMVPHLILTGPLSHWSPNWHPHTAHSIGPPSHWSPIALVPSHRLGPQFISPHRIVWTH